MQGDQQELGSQESADRVAPHQPPGPQFTRTSAGRGDRQRNPDAPGDGRRREGGQCCLICTSRATRSQAFAARHSARDRLRSSARMGSSTSWTRMTGQSCFAPALKERRRHRRRRRHGRPARSREMGRKPSKPGAIPRFRARKQKSGGIHYYYDHGGKPRRETPLGSNYGVAIKLWAEHEHANTIPAAAVVPSGTSPTATAPRSYPPRP